ncbi:MAG TPA: hypothetical protein PKC43_02290 [Phycisphaerales bacterium]|nr:hypothetical protein [Phycisphaerales bacterium]HMP36254.1 hypothetical protein [Phycisphaerales bacterium]
MRNRLDAIDRCVTLWMHRWGHPAHRLCLALFFLWMGLLKIFGAKTGSSLLAHTIYLGSPETMVVMLGAWEAAIGICLILPPLIRVALLMLFIRLPGTLLALVLKADVCFGTSIFEPTIEGQYIIKDFLLFSAAMVIGGTVRGGHHHRPPQHLQSAGS